MKYHPNIIYTTINDVFESANNNSKNDKNLLSKLMNRGKDRNKKQIKNINENNDIEKYKYINKDLIKSWIKAVKLSKKYFLLFLLNR